LYTEKSTSSGNAENAAEVYTRGTGIRKRITSEEGSGRTYSIAERTFRKFKRKRRRGRRLKEKQNWPESAYFGEKKQKPRKDESEVRRKKGLEV